MRQQTIKPLLLSVFVLLTPTISADDVSILEKEITVLQAVDCHTSASGNKS